MDFTLTIGGLVPPSPPPPIAGRLLQSDEGETVSAPPLSPTSRRRSLQSAGTYPLDARQRREDAVLRSQREVAQQEFDWQHVQREVEPQHAQRVSRRRSLQSSGNLSLDALPCNLSVAALPFNLSLDALPGNLLPGNLSLAALQGVLAALPCDSSLLPGNLSLAALQGVLSTATSGDEGEGPAVIVNRWAFLDESRWPLVNGTRVPPDWRQIYNTSDLGLFMRYFLAERLDFLTQGMVIISIEGGAVRARIEGSCAEIQPVCPRPDSGDPSSCEMCHPSRTHVQFRLTHVVCRLALRARRSCSPTFWSRSLAT